MPIEPLSTIIAWMFGISAIILIPLGTLCLCIFFFRLLIEFKD